MFAAHAASLRHTVQYAFKLLIHFLIGVSGREYFYDQVRRTDATFGVDFGRVAYYAYVGLDDGVYLI